MTEAVAENPDKYCPLYGVKAKNDKGYYCIKEDCALWAGHHCAILGIMYALRRIDTSLVNEYRKGDNNHG